MSANDCVKVAVRVRPMVRQEIERGCVPILEKTPGVPQVEITGTSNSKPLDLYAFNYVFMPEDSQEKVYMECVEPMIPKLFEGYNVTILAYGQTGSGKTHSMGTVFDGDWDETKVGIIPRALNDIFRKVEEFESTHSINVTCSFMELYQEQVYDLLSSKPRGECICDIREDGTKGIVVVGLSEVPIKHVDEAFKCLVRGGSFRTIGATAMNDVSSRSHAIFTVNVTMTTLEGNGKTNAKFHLVDLAGSERSKKTKATGTRFKEGVKINQGLLALGNVISALGGGTQNVTYISYRDSRLTRLLQDSLGGNSVTLMMACVSPADYNIEETLSTLRYADRAKKIKNKPVKNEDSHAIEIAQLKQQIQDLRMRLMMKDDEAAKSEPAKEGEEKPTSQEATSEKDSWAKLLCKPICKENMAVKDRQIFDLKSKLHAIICSMNELNSLHLIEDNFINEFITAYEEFRQKIVSTCPAEFAMPGTKVFEEIREKADAIQEMIKNYKSQLEESQLEDRVVPEPTDDVENKKYAEYANNQIAIFSQINDLERNMKIKQQLLERKFLNVPMMLDETTADKTITEYLETIQSLEKELEDVRAEKASSAVRRDHNATKVNMDRKHKIEKLEKDIAELRKKCASLEKTKKLAEQDRKRIEDLRKEIEEMKRARVQLIRQQKGEADMYKRFISTRDKEINTLKEKNRKAANEMKRKERLHETQQAVLKRKVEEAKAISKRLQDLADRNKKIRSDLNKTAGKRSDKNMVQDFIDHEIFTLHSTIDAKHTMQSLMNDRGTLLEALQALKATVQKTPEIESEIKQREDDLEMRNAQIADIRGKIAETDIEGKLKSVPENYKTVQELQVAMGYILRALVEARENFNTNKAKTEDLKTAYDASEERVEFLLEELAETQKLNDEEKSQMERDFEQKITLLYQKTKGELNKKEEEKCFNDMTEQLAAKFEENAVLKLRIQELEEQLKKKDDGTAEATSEKKKKPKKELNGTFTLEEDSEDESMDEDEDFNLDDSFNDPDWKKTPHFKQKRASRATATLLKESIVNRMDGTGMLINISETSDTSIAATKRTSGGNTKCSCRGSCATKLCGCRKNGFYCSSTCRCSHACLNQPNISKESNDGKGDDASTVQDKENEKTPEKRESRDNIKDITTPYYPYETKKRRPLLYPMND